MFNTAVLGLGYWGSKVLRNFSNHSGYQVSWICDHHSENLDIGKGFAPKAHVVKEPTGIFGDRDVELVVIATQASSHFDLAYRALESGKHVLVEKPFGRNALEAEKLVSLAQKMNRRIFVDHTLLFSAGYQEFKRKVGELGRGPGLYLSNRSDAAKFPKDCGVVEHLLYHDLYLVDDLFGLGSISESFLHESQVLSPYQSDFAAIHLRDVFERVYMLQSDMNSPKKIRLLSYANQKGKAVWDDTLEKQTKEPLLEMVGSTWESLQSGAPAIHEGTRALEVMRFIERLEKLGRVL